MIYISRCKWVYLFTGEIRLLSFSVYSIFKPLF